jgi:hypothetical protein
MIYTATCIMFWMRAYPIRGEVGGGWALEFESLGYVEWHRADRRVPFGAQRLQPLTWQIGTTTIHICRTQQYAPFRDYEFGYCAITDCVHQLFKKSNQFLFYCRGCSVDEDSINANYSNICKTN